MSFIFIFYDLILFSFKYVFYMCCISMTIRILVNYINIYINIISTLLTYLNSLKNGNPG